MVEALAELDLLVVGIDILTEALRLAEVEWCTLNLQDFTCWNGCGVSRQIEVCVDLTDLVLDSGSRICCSCQ